MNNNNYYFKLKKENEIEHAIKKILDSFNSNELIDFDINRIKFAHSAIGWKTSFTATKYFKNIKELKTFYENNKNYLEVVDDYDIVYDFRKFIDLIEHEYSLSKFEFENYNNYYFDDENYQWVKEV